MCKKFLLYNNYMKRLFGIVIIFFALAISLLIGSNEQQASSVNTADCIQKVQVENVVLASSNMPNGEISVGQQKESSDFSGSTPFALTYQSVNDFSNKTKTQSNGYSIHNISTNKQKTRQIRAP